LGKESGSHENKGYQSRKSRIAFVVLLQNLWLGHGDGGP